MPLISEVQFAVVNQATTSTLVAAQAAGVKVRVVSLFLVNTAAQTLTFKVRLPVPRSRGRWRSRRMVSSRCHSTHRAGLKQPPLNYSNSHSAVQHKSRADLAGSR